MKLEEMQASKSIGTVSEIRVATLLNSDNEFLNYPIDVLVHVFERSIHGEIMYGGCTVCDGNGSWVLAKGAVFTNMSEILPYKYQEVTPAEIRQIIKNIDIFQSKKLITTNNTLGVFDL